MVREFGRDAITVKTNVASQSQVQAAVEKCVSELGRVDITVANAGVGERAPCSTWASRNGKTNSTST